MDFQTYNKVHNILCALSITSSLFVAMVIIVIWVYNKEAVDRVSIRLTLAMLVSDALFTTASIWANHQEVGWVSTFCMWIYLFAFNSFCFLNITIVLNLYLIFVQGRRNAVNLERIYFLTVFSMAFTLATLPAAFGVIGADPVARTCWYINEKSTSARVWQLVTYVIPSLSCVIFCTITLILVMVHLLRQRAYFARDAYSCSGNIESSRRAIRHQRMINLMVTRIILYPIVIILVRFPIVFVIAFVYVRKDQPIPPWSPQTTQICDASQGFLNALVFCLDPALHSAWYSFRVKMTRQYCLRSCLDSSFRNNIVLKFFKLFAFKSYDEESLLSDSFKYTDIKTDEDADEIKKLL
ncbi:hypothetical protein K7432_002669 [Basidiobolus ranarum]|uniref:G-protein coupled receptors family 2 profile 2 domain-containing protein n=1 Tax=Basidiobolus ranarum TaxID=34480 RepID=A0ABR2W7V9_9FUNG